MKIVSFIAAATPRGADHVVDGRAGGRPFPFPCPASLGRVARPAAAHDTSVRPGGPCPTTTVEAAPDAPGRSALWVPRVLLSPVYFTTEWLLRRPLGAALSAAERADLPNILYNFFAFGPDHKAGIAPIAFVDFGFNRASASTGSGTTRSSGDDLRVHASFWTNDWIGASLVQRVRFHGKDSVQLKLVGVRRPDHVFYGIGPGHAPVGPEPLRGGQARLRVLVDFPLLACQQDRRRRRGALGVVPRWPLRGRSGILQNVAANVFPLPDGFGAWVHRRVQRRSGGSRFAPAVPGRGLGGAPRGAGGAGQRTCASRRARDGCHTAAGAGGFWDVNGKPARHQPVGDSDVLRPAGRPARPLHGARHRRGRCPLTRCLPGSHAGYFPGRLVDRSAAVATLRYKWPIAPWVAGSLQGAVGNVFAEHLQGFDTRLLPLLRRLRHRERQLPDSSFELIVGFGTETFEHGGQIDSLRLALGITRF